MANPQASDTILISLKRKLELWDPSSGDSREKKIPWLLDYCWQILKSDLWRGDQLGGGPVLIPTGQPLVAWNNSQVLKIVPQGS